MICVNSPGKIDPDLSSVLRENYSKRKCGNIHRGFVTIWDDRAHPWRKNTQGNQYWMHIVTRKVSDTHNEWDFLLTGNRPRVLEAQRMPDLLLAGRLSWLPLQ